MLRWLINIYLLNVDEYFDSHFQWTTGKRKLTRWVPYCQRHIFCPVTVCRKRGQGSFLHTVHSISGTAQVDQMEAGFRQLDAELQKPGITSLTETAQHAGVAPGKTHRSLPAPARLLHILRERPEASPLSTAPYEEDTSSALDTLRCPYRIHKTPDKKNAASPYLPAIDES
ncbi:hypothetical protein RCO06_08040 [Escherichia marmotae]|nr:hypothetical protein [Escherichia marmotae]MED9040604.1 hypothetical protein [Escherichia ruysiae]MED9612452.1 hypothetical protein [Escherichia marmotae]MED9631260.1 hypothetical protein [Escherichia marmotae]MED9767881.1 hypothetical protein [Escherichia marmotae]